MSGKRPLHVPFKGNSQSLPEGMAGRIDFTFAGIASARSLIQSGKVRALAVTTKTRTSPLPEPTIAEVGLPSYEYTATPHTEQGPCMLAANIHVDASTPNFLIQEFFTRDIPLYQAVLKDASFPMPKDGFIELPTKPGLGIDLDEAVLTKKPFTYKPGLSLGRLWSADTRVLRYPSY